MLKAHTKAATFACPAKTTLVVKITCVKWMDALNAKRDTISKVLTASSAKQQCLGALLATRVILVLNAAGALFSKSKTQAMVVNAILPIQI